jgi:multiple sugar transport system substrate-binding protein
MLRTMTSSPANGNVLPADRGDAMNRTSSSGKLRSMPTPAELSDTPANQMFLNGRAAMYWGGSWSNAELLASDLVEDIEVAPLPAGPGGSATVIHGLTNAVSAKSKNKAAAQAFQAFLSGKEAALIQAKAGAAVPAFNGTQQAWIDSAPWKLQVFLAEAEKSAHPYPISLKTAEWNQLEVELLPQALSGERPVEEVAAELAAQMNEILAGEQ